MKVVLLTAAIDEDQLIQALQLGVRGVVLKDMAPSFSYSVCSACRPEVCGSRKIQRAAR